MSVSCSGPGIDKVEARRIIVAMYRKKILSGPFYGVASSSSDRSRNCPRYPRLEDHITRAVLHAFHTN